MSKVLNKKHRDFCDFQNYADWLCMVAPAVLWFKTEDVGSYSGQVFGLGAMKGKIVFYEDYYGSCSGCGSWGEGGEPESEADVLEKSTQYAIEEVPALREKFAKLRESHYEKLPEEFDAALGEVLAYLLVRQNMDRYSLERKTREFLEIETK
ncbi:MAG: hypothetical protein K2W95_00965 [Candidatus Obscuribacterales bacterium]|nr:hypothetical protein [Candidatus Obscuribacterales bacterium]